jgi:hypothetical protein
MKLKDAQKVTGIELLRRADNLFSTGSESFAERFDIHQLLKLAQGYMVCAWDIHPDHWEEQQIIDLLVYDKIPEWDDEEMPMYE